ncbi:YqaJ viral recombinase family protein [Hungatella effluvii]|uniref:YqaJ viral recombinase family nuclease n=1 Tax=Hungatella effluvii TaxID=1096246 RepID=UPI0022E6C668|nr:YqaJ viral recombinase family protein [Hungatella effluvii]
MKKIVSTLNLSHEDWLKYRNLGIGGSDAGAICGLNPYASPMRVYHDKTREDTEDCDNESMRQGRDLEDYVARRFMEATGKKARRSNAMYQSEEYPFMLANVDRLIVGEQAGLECKTASAYNADKWKDDNIPAHYQIQCHHYMAVTGANAWYLAVVILGREFKYIKIERDEAIIRDLIKIESDFWYNHVLARAMPEPDGSDICDEVIKQYYPHGNQETIVLPDSFNLKLKRRETLQEMIDRLTKEQKQIEQEIKLFMQEHESAVGDRYQVTWSGVDSARLDTTKLKKERPEIYQSYANVSHTRRFTVKAA